MKSYQVSPGKLYTFSLMGIVGILVASCGSYRSSSYYDDDGIYSSKSERTTETNVQDSYNSSNVYREYF
ncbi:MAG TPA: hypothetical protein VLZ72_02765, partial [Flavobacterium sp.]|nr:hypothetical protein [Flavobacterium sp.]